ncbi:SDR family NAD(P)-dependent oxidoreductase [Kibdelosporangium phytohabitans]|uniref:3-oxoacyl-ACP reductase n=1 Tax=Kibdelosporangium phytohabitans TaxID=860235 RepID=A0A0N9I2H5_9PSEU|nr:SDR family oxidoreductase [Kibdelosporangium phytohabitans]ALG10235.1 3-oxoacyl-ACP reductase [Kibdelosporangium phytohabitans]MBE1461261.1 meso-butanediol dehydrogenase/(S,S)-butanediol dehydrogenase/diacetyl reductase [Kibdelosporangium phytohabitans]
MSRFTGRVVVVTGGGSGIGAAVAHRFAAEGATVVVVGRTREKLDKTAASAPAGATVLARTADLTVPDEVDALISSVVTELGRLDVLVNNAGAPSLGTVETVTPDQWRAAMAINLDAVYLTSRASLRHLREAQGSIVNIGSMGGLAADYGTVAYNTAKGALVNLTRAMAADHAPEVRVNAVHPGFTLDTGMTAGVTPDMPLVRAYADRIPFGRVAEADEIAGVATFLAGPDARYVTGAQIPVDGGISATTGQPRLSDFFG